MTYTSDVSMSNDVFPSDESNIIISCIPLDRSKLSVNSVSVNTVGQNEISEWTMILPELKIEKLFLKNKKMRSLNEVWYCQG